MSIFMENNPFVLLGKQPIHIWDWKSNLCQISNFSLDISPGVTSPPRLRYLTRDGMWTPSSAGGVNPSPAVGAGCIHSHGGGEAAKTKGKGETLLGPALCQGDALPGSPPALPEEPVALHRFYGEGKASAAPGRSQEPRVGLTHAPDAFQMFPGIQPWREDECFGGANPIRPCHSPSLATFDLGKSGHLSWWEFIKSGLHVPMSLD